MNRCGTYDGWNDHRRENSITCRDCCEAQAIYMSRLRRRKMLGLPIRAEELKAPRWVDRYGDMAQAGAVFYAGVVMGA